MLNNKIFLPRSIMILLVVALSCLSPALAQADVCWHLPVEAVSLEVPAIAQSRAIAGGVDNAEDILQGICRKIGYCRPQDEVALRSEVLKRLNLPPLLGGNASLALGPPSSISPFFLNLHLDRTMRVEIRNGNTSIIVRLSPGVNASILTGLYCPRLGLSAEDGNCASLTPIIESKLRDVGDDFCSNREGRSLIEQAKDAGHISTVLGPSLSEGIRSRLGPSVQSMMPYAWEVRSPLTGSIYSSSQRINLQIVLRAGDQELSMAEVEDLAGCTLTVMTSFDLDTWRPLPGRMSHHLLLRGLMGHHLFRVQIFDEKDYPVSGLMAVPFRLGAFLSDLDAIPAVQAFYSLYPDLLFERAKFLEQVQGPGSGRNSFMTAVHHLGVEAIPPPRQSTLSILLPPPVDPASLSPPPSQQQQQHGEKSSLSTPASPPPPPPHQQMQQGKEKFIGFHLLLGGLNNQLVELAGMISIANALDRTLVLPRISSVDFIGHNEVVEPSRLFDVEALRANLVGYVHITTEEELERKAEKLPAKTEYDFTGIQQRKMDLVFYVDRFGGAKKGGGTAAAEEEGSTAEEEDTPYIYLRGGYGTFHAHRGSLIIKQVRQAIRYSLEVQKYANQLHHHLLSLSQNNGLLAVHTRIEVDWRGYSQTRELTSNHLARYWFSTEEIAYRIARHERLAHLGSRVIYVAVGAGMVEDPRPIFANILRGDKINNSSSSASARAAAEGGQGTGEVVQPLPVVVTKWDLIPETRSLPYSLQSAIDLLICEKATAFVGTSHSTFTNAVAVAHEALGKTSYIYNVPTSDVVLPRTDGGRFTEPHDSTYIPTRSFYQTAGWVDG